MQGRYRVVVVDDSSFMRKFICDILSTDKSLQVVGTAVNGIDAVEKVKALKPNVVTMDIEMPEMNGLTALKIIMQECATPVVMLSNRTKVGADATVEALELGAVDFIAKPSGNISLDLEKIQDELILKVKVAARAYHRIVNLTPMSTRPQKDTVSPPAEVSSVLTLQKIVAIGTSTGGPRALQTVLSGIPGNVSAGFVMVQHMPAGFTKSLAERLNNVSELNVSEAKDGDEVMAGKALLAPGDKHMKIKRVGNRFYVKLTDEPPIGGLRPTVDKMMESLAECEVPIVGVLLTGMGQDGSVGLQKIKAVNGFTIAEDESTCVVYGMPRAAIESKCVDRVAPLHWVSQEIVDNL